MSTVWRQQIFLAMVSALVFFTNLGAYALFDEDEPKNAVCGAEMFERGDWIVPTFNAELRTDKPILIYWWMHLSFRAFGVSEFSARLGSAILAVGTVFLTYHLGRMLYSSTIGCLGATILATCLMFSAVGRAVTPDSTLIFCLMLAFTSYVWAVARRRGGHFSGDTEGTITLPQELLPGSVWTSLPMYAAMGMAILAKGPIGVLLPCTIIGLLLLVTGRRSELADGRLVAPTGPWWRRTGMIVLQVMRPVRIWQAGLAMRLVLGAVIVLSIALPWYVVVGIKTDGAWLRGFLGDHNLGRFLESKENHGGPIFYYAIVLLMGCFPWSMFLPLAVWQLRGRLMRGATFSDSDRLLACWTGVWFVFFSLARTKLPNYVLPMYPALALIVARYLYDWKQSAPDVGLISYRLSCQTLGAIGILMMIGLGITMSILLPGEEPLLLVGLIPLVGAILSYRAARSEQRERSLQIFTGTAILLATAMIGIAPTRIGLHQDSPKLAEAARTVSGMAHPTIAVIDAYSPSLIFYTRTPVRGLRGPSEVTDFIQANPNGFVVTRADRLERLPIAENQLVEVTRCRRFLRKYDVVLLARQPAVIAGTDLSANR
ncbi:MAG: glycosyltransferase family 39 protein [Planctomycetes bacterium]|nr:glycosyltransferase family 39 protein [Planctomycetota bacterium]